ncbi:MAG: polymer-forming cytoskeletal protein [bacterium]|nr:polymer-forming cytoskeletal protein [bacterium]
MACFRIFAVILLAAVVLPSSLSAATYVSARTLVVSESPLENAYLAGTDVTVAASLPGDVLAAGGTISIAAPVAGDAMVVGGTVSVTRPVEGDLRAVGAQVTISAPVSGDLALAGGTVTASSTASDTRIIGGTIRVIGSGGRVVVYGAQVYLSGTFEGNVEVTASDRLTLLEGTIINGSLRYNAPQEAAIPASASIRDGVTYTGASSYLPTVEQAQTFAIAGASVFFLVRILAVLIAAALLAGLFPVFAQAVADRALSRSPGRFALLVLLGFAVVFATPVFIFILLVSFVGIGVAFLLLALYSLLLMLGYLYAGVLAGAALGRGLMKREVVTWKLAILGMLVLYLVGTVPVVGSILTFILFLAATGTIVMLAHRFAFGRIQEDPAIN